MLKTLLVLPDGTQLFSGSDGASVAASRLTRCVNTQKQLEPGAVCPAMLECTLVESDQIQIQPGQEIEVYLVDEAGQRDSQGIFIAQQPVRKGYGLLELTAYDRLIKLDRDLTQWLKDLDAWPYSLRDFAQMICQGCGVELVNAPVCNGDFPVQPFAATSVTGRQLLSWVAQVGGCFCRANAAGQAEFAWYAPKAVCQIPAEDSAYFDGSGIALQFDDGDGVLENGDLSVTTGQLDFLFDGQEDLAVRPGSMPRAIAYAGALSWADYTTEPVEKVQLRAEETDVGTLWPDDPAEKNTYILSGNPLLSAQNAQSLVPVAQKLYEHLSQVIYTPGKGTLMPVADICVGDILTLTDPEGNPADFYIMEQVIADGGMEVACIGEPNREHSTAANNRSPSALNNKVLRLRTDVDGLFAQNADTQGALSSLELDVGGIRTAVQQQQAVEEGLQTQLSSLSQTAQEVKIDLQKIREEGADKVITETGYSFTEEGLKIHKSGQEMENLLDSTGMYVKRAGQVLLQADATGVQARDVTVKNYLIVGEHARLEDYGTGRTACFWL